MVVTRSAPLCALTFPAASNADTVYEYWVEGVRPVFINDTVVLVPTWRPLRKILYPATPMLSVDAPHEGGGSKIRDHRRKRSAAPNDRTNRCCPAPTNARRCQSAPWAPTLRLTTTFSETTNSSFRIPLTPTRGSCRPRPHGRRRLCRRSGGCGPWSTWTSRWRPCRRRSSFDRVADTC